MHPRLGAGYLHAVRAGDGAVTDLTRRALILGLLLGAFGCSSSLVSCSSPLMSCPSPLTDAEEEDGLHGDVTSGAGALAETQPNAVAESGATERLRAEERTSPESGPGAVVRIALQHLGVPYRWGGLTPAGFDCSGFVKYLHARVGISIPHNVAAQYRYGTPVSRDQLEPGDLVFFDRLRHNGIYIGHGQFIHASKTGDGVKISSLDELWYKSRWVGGRRLAGEVFSHS